MRFFLPTIMLLIFLYSCNNNKREVNEEIETELFQCLRNSGKDYNGETINLFNTLIEVEAVLIEEKMLKINDKKTYLELYESVIGDKINSKDVLNRINEKVPQSYLITVPTNFSTNIDCFSYVIEKNSSIDTKSVLYKEYERLKHIFENGDSSFSQYEKIINILGEDFNKPIYRMPLIALLYSQIEYSNRK